MLAAEASRPPSHPSSAALRGPIVVGSLARKTDSSFSSRLVSEHARAIQTASDSGQSDRSVSAATNATAQHPPNVKAKSATHPTKPPKRTAQDLWALVRASYLSQSSSPSPATKRPPNIGASLIPYPLTIRHGFQPKYTLRHRQQQVLCACSHVKIPTHHAEGRITADYAGVVNGDEDGMGGCEAGEVRSAPGSGSGKQIHGAEKDGSNGSDSTNTPSTSTPAASSQQSSSSAYTFVTIDRTRTATIWDIVAGTASHKPRAVVRCPMEVEQIAYVARMCVYVGVGCGRGLKFFNSRFECVQICRTAEPVLFVKYNKTTGEIVTAGSHDISIWGLEGIQIRNNKANSSGTYKVVATLKHTFHTELPEESWISDISLDEPNGRVFAAVGTQIVICETQHLSGTATAVRTISTRHVKTIIQHDLYQYTIIACADGSIQIRNMANAIIHEFNAHTQSVTALAMYPHGQVLMSAGMDSSVRMFDLNTFREIYCLHLRNKPLSMHVIDDQLMYVRTAEGLQVWGTNHINSVFANVNSNLTTLLRSDASSTFPPRLIARTEDGVVRLISPVSGKTLTAALPILDTDVVTAIAYSGRTDRMYMMLGNNEIWVIATNANPCAVVDIWRASESSREDCNLMTLFEGRFPDTFRNAHTPATGGATPVGALDAATVAGGYTFLLGATRNGQVVVYKRRGAVGDRCQLHAGEMTHMIASTEHQLLFTSGVDEHIRISSVVPTALNSGYVVPKIAIPTPGVPRVIAVLGDVICAGLDDYSVQMWRFNVARKSYTPINPHNRSDDHTDAITSIVPIPSLSLFLTSSHDGHLKLWDTQNTLLREIQFTESINHIALASDAGDLIFSFENRLDIMRGGSYLPPAYVMQAQKVAGGRWTEAEGLVPFNEFDLSWQDLRRGGGARRVGGGAMQGHEHWRLFHECNLGVPERAITDAATAPMSAETLTSPEEAEFNALMARLQLLAHQRQQLIDAARKRMEADQADMARQEEIVHEEFRRYLQMRKFKGNSSVELEELPIDFEPTTPATPRSPSGEASEKGRMAGELEAAAGLLGEYAMEMDSRLRNAMSMRGGGGDGLGSYGGRQKVAGDVAPNAEEMEIRATTHDYEGEMKGRRGSRMRGGVENDIEEESEGADGSPTQRKGRFRSRENEKKERELRIRSRERQRKALLRGENSASDSDEPTPRTKPYRPSLPTHSEAKSRKSRRRGSKPDEPSPTTETDTRRKSRIPAPDGALPNSFVRSQVESWKQAHTNFTITDLSLTAQAQDANAGKQAAVNKITAAEEARKKRSEEYKERLKDMLERLPKEEEVVEVVEEGEAAADAAGEGEEEGEKGEPPVRSRLPAHRMKVEALVPREVVVRKESVEEEVFPPAVERLMMYDWAPVDEIFQPLEVKPGAKSPAAPSAPSATSAPSAISKPSTTSTPSKPFTTSAPSTPAPITTSAGTPGLTTTPAAAPPTSRPATPRKQSPAIRARHRKLKQANPTPTHLLPSILTTFRAPTTTPTDRTEILEYINYLYDLEGIDDVGVAGVMKALGRYLATPVEEGMDVDGMDEVGEEEVKLRCTIMETMAKLAPTHTEVVPGLLVQSVARQPEIRARAIEYLQALGVYAPDNKFLTSALDGLMGKTPPEPVITPKAGEPPADTHPDPIAPPPPTSKPPSRTSSGSNSRPTSASRPAAKSTTKNAKIPPIPEEHPKPSTLPPPQPDLRTTVTNFLKTALRSYLIRATPNTEVRAQLKGMNIHGFEVKKAKSAKTDVGKRSRPGSAVGKEGGETAETKGKKKKVVFDPNLVMGPTGGETTATVGDGKPVVVPTSATVLKPAINTTTALGSTSGGTTATATAFTMPDMDMDMSVLMESITYRPSLAVDESYQTSGSNATFQQSVRRSIARHTATPPSRPTTQGSTGSGSGGVNARSAVSILQNPLTADFITAINFYMLDLQHQQMKAEQEALAKLRAQEEARVARAKEEAERRAKMEMTAQKERERIERLEAKKRALVEAKMGKDVGGVKGKAAEREKEEGGGGKRRLVDMRTKGIGLTHRSACHPSRETLDYDQSKFPPLSPSELSHRSHHHHRQGGGGQSTDLSMHIGKYNRSMPMERVSLLPFDPFAISPPYSSSSGIKPLTPSRGDTMANASNLGSNGFGSSMARLTSGFSASRPPTSVPLGSHLQPTQLSPQWRTFSVEDITADVLERELIGIVPGAELRYIRSAGIRRRRGATGQGEEDGDGGLEDRKFRTQRKYFIPALSVALETVAAGQTYSLTD
ncbi:uncharacterized protein EV422DRAFT_595512 [Fimicolochytrium jonesii]|uniref:uncharacterized protein n=1 Tax=Fimicolochytrium jonesii TaxID=1396493 RepID=UPI0022FE9247|nr:uncharacterized protein EV422DRAFT_595512 [Fimicolochytrium jonesii]KAI8821143.1 hypothetical protein EV422DRAFT_595512 [Fimicolochytrium jonesii]